MKQILAAAALLTMATMPALADQAAADACAAGLTPNAATIYKVSVGAVATGGDVRTVVTDQTKALVEAGSLSLSAARPAAEAAGKCLKLLP